MEKREVSPADGLGLADAIGLLRDELLKARAAGADSDIQLPVESMTVDLNDHRYKISERQDRVHGAGCGLAVGRWRGA